MKKIFAAACLCISYLISFSQPIPRQSIEDSVIGWMNVYKFKGVKAEAGTNIISEASEATGTPSYMAGQGISDLSIDGGIEGRISLISGKGSIYGTGIFEK